MARLSQNGAKQVAFSEVALVKQTNAKPSHTKRNVLINVGISVAVVAIIFGVAERSSTGAELLGAAKDLYGDVHWVAGWGGRLVRGRPLVGLYFGEKIGVLDEARSWPCYLRQPAHRRHVVEAIQ